MKRTAIIAATLLGLVLQGPASADLLYPAALTFETGYATGPPPGFPWWGDPPFGDPLAMMGRVATVGAPFEDLFPAGYELTWEFAGSTCTEFGQWDNMPCSGGNYGMFSTGAVTCYLDNSPDADFGNPATFRDGTVVLVALIDAVLVADDDPQAACPMLPDQPDVRASFTFTGGAWFARVSSGGVGFLGISEGEIEPLVPPALQQLGYIFPVDGRVDIYGPVPAETTTWGRVKALYR